MNRRKFIQAAAASVALGGGLISAVAQVPGEPNTKKGEKGMIWGNLMHLSFNMWCDWDPPEVLANYTNAAPDLRFDPPLWDELLQRMSSAGLTMV